MTDLTFYSNSAAPGGENLLNDTQAQTGSLTAGLGGEKRLKNLIMVLRVYTPTIVGKRQHYGVVLPGRPYIKLSFFFTVGGLNGVLHQHEEYLIYFPRIAGEFGQVAHIFDH